MDVYKNPFLYLRLFDVDLKFLCIRKQNKCWVREIDVYSTSISRVFISVDVVDVDYAE